MIYIMSDIHGGWNEYRDILEQIQFSDNDHLYMLGDAIDRNYQVWSYSFQPEYDMLKPTARNPRDYGEAIAQLKAFFHKRLAWMDENIDTLRQYSAESKVKKFNENAN